MLLERYFHIYCMCLMCIKFYNIYFLIFKFYNIYFLVFKFYSLLNLMPNFITKIFFVEFLSNFKVAEPELKLELGDLARGGSDVVSPSEPPFGRPSY
jgi:hypothetical protein